MHRLVTAFVVVLLGTSAHARLIPAWPYDRLLKEADVVVIAEAMETEETGKTTQLKPWKVDFIEVSTTFAVQGVLKGKVEGKSLKVLHYRLKDLVENGPLLVSFRSQKRVLETKGLDKVLPKPQYLLFLKQTKDGQFEPVSGQVDPVFSVREVSLPLQDR